MRTINFTTKILDKTCPIYVGKGLLAKVGSLLSLKQYSRIAILTDTNVQKYWLSSLENRMGGKIDTIVVNPGENKKSLETAKNIWNKLFEFRLDRHSLLINLGGGVICDLGGFAAGLYMRGVPFANIPTTLLAQVDASIGGKVAVNFGGNKNGVGFFTSPAAVIADLDFLKTLPEREFISGFAEVLKHGFITGGKYFSLVTSKRPKDFLAAELEEIIFGSCQIKKKYVETDRDDKSIRRVLNFGHTIGHALESLSTENGERLLHGEAVALGMLAESKLAEKVGLLSIVELKIMGKAIKQAGLPVRLLGKIRCSQVMEKIIFDKKSEAGRVQWSLPRKIGEIVPGVDVPGQLVLQTIDSLQR